MSGVTALATPAAADGGTPSVPAQPLRSRTRGPVASDVTDAAWLHATVTPPTAGIAGVTLPASGYAQAGDLPVYVATTAADSPASVRVQVFDQPTVDAIGARFFAVRVTRTDGSRYEAPLSIAIDYSGVRHAFGGDFALRLRLQRLDACVLQDPSCATPVAVPAHLDAQRLVADVVAEADPTAAPTSDPLPGIGPTVYPMTSGAGGETGTYAASPLPETDRWSVGTGSGDFGYSYPIPVPPSLGGPAPSLSLDYSSQSVDGRTLATNSQPSQVGEGWSLENGYIERRFTSCADDGFPTNLRGNLCWAPTMEYYLHFGGNSGEIVQSTSTNEWRLRDDPAWRIQSWTGGSNGDNDGEYFTLYTPDGTRYWFGLGTEPRNTPTRYTNSTLTVPVFAGSGEPCYNTVQTASFCTQAWRWNLDRVQDPATNIESLFYAKETNYYRRDTTSGLVSQYDRASEPTRIEYSKRSGSESATAPSVVTFTTAHRCSAQASCPTPSPSAGTSYPDVPLELMCTSPTSCPAAGQSTPTFWSTEEITRITTYVLNSGGGLSDVDAVDLAYSFPATTDGTDPALWLRTITRTGTYGGTSIALPSVLLAGTHLPNRVDYGTGVPQADKYRVTGIVSETGGQTTVTYGSPYPCAAPYPQWDQNQTDCFPQQVTGGFGIFHKYVATQVVADDLVGSAPSRTTTYTYEDAPAWHYVNQLNVPASNQTWSDYRGHAQVKVLVSGDATTAPSATRYHLYRGMDGDRLVGNVARSANVTDEAGNPFRDYDYLAGRPLESDVYSQWGTWFRTEQHRYWKQQTLPGPTTTVWPAQPHSAQYVRESVLADLAKDTSPGGGAWRSHEVDSTFSATYGVLTSAYDHGSDTCRKLTYTVNVTNAWLLDVPYSDKTVDGACTGTTVVANKDLYYDNLAYAAAPAMGRVTQTDVYTTSTAKSSTKVGYDGYNRVVSLLTPNQVAAGSSNATVTTYTPSTGFPYTSVVVARPASATATYTTTTVLEPGHAVPQSVTDENGQTTTVTRDALGRVTGVRRPGDPGMDSTQYVYAVAQGSPSRVNTRQLLSGTNYLDSFVYYDGFGDPIESHAEGPNGGRVVSVTRYDAQGHPRLVSQPFYNSSAIGTGVVNPLDANLPVATRTTYDSVGRVASTEQLAFDAQQWQTTYDHFEWSDVAYPPAPAAAVTTYTDVLGRVSKVTQRPGGASADTTYAYTRRGDLDTVTDAAGNVWDYDYDLAGRRTRSKDPDRGTWSETYDADGNVLTETDATPSTVTYAYDVRDRRLSATSGGTTLASWTYDSATLGHGRPASASRVVSGASYTVSTPGYDGRGRPSGLAYTIPSVEGGLAGTWTYGYAYDFAGHRTSVSFPGVGSLLSAETLSQSYSATGYPTTLAGTDTYVSATGFNNQGMLVSRQLGSTTEGVARTFGYDAVYRLNAFSGVLTHAGSSSTIQNEALGYDADANLTSSTDNTTGQTECFRYSDGLNRLTAAFTTASTSCTAYDGAGPDPYNLTYAYNAIGDTTSATDGGVVTVPTYNPSGPTSVRPHAMTASGALALTYDANGALATRTMGSAMTTFAFDPLHALASSTPTGGPATTYVTDASGNRLVQHNPDGTGTLYLDGMEITAPLTSGAAPTRAVRYYGPATRIAGGTDAGLWWRLGNQQNSATVTANASTGAVRTQRYRPYGTHRNVTSSLPTPRGFLDKTEDPSGLDNLGARLYDPSIGQFSAPDPLLNPANPQTLNPYAYSLDNPETLSDPSGFEPHHNADGTWGGFGCENDVCTTANTIENHHNHNLSQQVRVETRQQKIAKVLADLDTTKKNNLSAYQDSARRDCLALSTWTQCEGYYRINEIERTLHPPGVVATVLDIASVVLLLSPLAFADAAAIEAADATIVATGATEAGGAASTVSRAGLASQLTEQEAKAIFTESGTLQPSIIADSIEIMDGTQLGNQSLVKALTADGSSIADWGKYATDNFRSPSGTFQVHFYYNPSTGSVFYDLDYKVVFAGGGE